LKRRDQGDEMTLSSLGKGEDDEPNWKSGGSGLFSGTSGGRLFGDDGSTTFKADSLFGSSSNSDLGGLSTARKPEEVKWYYRDPSGQVQGPFEAQEMQDWYKAGFFTPTLMLCRDDETVFEPLMVLIRKVGNEDQPFLTARPPVTRPSPLAGAGDIFGSHADTGSGLFRNGPDLQSKYMPFGSTAAPTTPGGSIMDNFLGGGMPTAPLYQSPYNTYGNSLLRDNRWNTNEQAQASPSWLNPNPAELFGGPTSPLGASPFMNQQPNSTMFASNMNSPSLFDYQRPIDPMDHQHQQYNLMLQQKQQQQSMQFQQQFHQMQFQQDQQPLSQQQAPNTSANTTIVSAAPSQQQTSPQNAFKNTPLEHISSNNNVIGSNHASPVMRPNILSSSGGWGSAPGTPIGTDAPSSPWGSIVSAAIPTKISEELQAKAPGAQSPRAPSSPKKAIEKPTKPTSISTPAVSTAPTATTTTTTSTKAAVITAPATSAPATTAPVTKAVIQSFAEIQLEEQQKAATRNAAKAAAMEQAAEKAAQAAAITEETPVKASTPVAPSVPKPVVSLREIQEEELRIANEKKAKHAKQAAAAITTPSWAASNNTPLSSTTTGTWSQPTHKPLSLREIQEMEAKQAAEAKKASAAQYLAHQEQLANSTPNILSWGVVVPNSKPTSSTASNNQSGNVNNAAAWTAPTGPKKTLREIQQEEELAMKKKNAKATKTAAAIAAAAASTSTTNASSKAYAVPSAPAAGGAWTTVTSTRAPKPVPAPAPAPIVATPPPQPTQWTPVKQTPTKPVARAPSGPSEDFRRWCRKALRDLNSGVNQEEIVDMLLSFPADTNASEIIEDVIYANSLRIDGKRFAQEFMKRRKADIAGRLDIVTAGLEEDDDDDFKVVVTKKGKKKNNA
jgi:hypothetical protein